jgi:hypothetical protein
MKWWIAGLVSLLAACDYWSLQVNSDGLLLVSVIGDDRPRGGGYRVRTRHPDGSTRTLDVPDSGSLSMRSSGEGLLELTLLPPDGCRVSPPNPRTLMVAADQQINVAFDVNCNSLATAHPLSRVPEHR